ADVADMVWNGFCTEYCGYSHANMRIRAYTVKPEEFDQWTAAQKQPAVFNSPLPPATPASTSKGMASAGNANGLTTQVSGGTLAMKGRRGSRAAAAAAPAAATPQTPPAPVVGTPGWFFPEDKLPDYVKPKTPTPAGLD